MAYLFRSATYCAETGELEGKHVCTGRQNYVGDVAVACGLVRPW